MAIKELLERGSETPEYDGWNMLEYIAGFHVSRILTNRLPVNRIVLVDCSNNRCNPDLLLEESSTYFQDECAKRGLFAEVSVSYNGIPPGVYPVDVRDNMDEIALG
jgi:hypothetical protein